MKSHAAIGSQMLETLSGAGNEEYLRYAYNICRYHHERWDGGGYPDGLVGDEIPICAQTVGLADVYDALTTNRVYKDAYSFDTATNMILNGECGTFSPKLLECFKRVRGEFERLARSYADGYSPKSDAIKVPLPGPDSRKNGLDTLQMVQVKCQLLLHYLEVTAVEVDLDHGVYHLLYNPNPDLAALGQARTFPEAIERLAQEVAHPDDRRMITEGIDSYLEEFFASGLRRHTRRYRLFNQMREEYQWYNVVVLRIDMAETESRKAIILWAQEEESARQVEAALRERTPVTGFLGIFQCCRNDRYLTMKGIGQGLISLLGYTEEEINTRFHGRMIELLLPETRERVLTTLREQLIDGNTVRLEMQMRHKNGSVVCMLAKAYLALGEDGAEYFYGLLVDITETKASQERLRLSLERHRIIMDQTNDIVFEWDMREDTLVCSPKWKERFGYEPFTTNVTENLIRASHWHPEDVQIFVEKVQSLRDGANYVEAEVRIANSEGRYLWNRIRVTGLADGQGNVTRAVGVIINIDREKRAAQKLMDQVERDSLTGLLNKAASRRQMEEYLASRNADSYSALLIIDLDNFKAVNDRYGHMFGDEVLMKASQQISGLFRAKDVIARIGGDEFMVFMQDIPGRELVRERCESLKEIFQRLYREELAACGLSCSIGVACAPEHGSAYQELFQRADIAMYQAKGQGKNCFVFYDEVSAIPADFTIQRKRIDSDDQPGMASNMLVPYVFRRLYESGDMDKTIQDVLGMVGQQMNVSRVYIFENTPDDRYCSNTFEWCSAGIPPEINNLQLVSYETDIPGYQDSFDERGIFYCPDVSKLPQNVQEILEPQGIRSMLQCAIRDNGTFKGYVGFDECNENRLWTKDQIELLTYLSQVMSVFLMKKRAQDACAKQEKG